MSSVQIHPTSLVEKGAELDQGVVVGPFCWISPRARVGKDTQFLSHCVVDGIVEIGTENFFHPGCVIGGYPQDLAYKGEETKVVIGNKNRFRESCTVNRGTPKDKTLTRIEHENYFMAYCHVAHDCTVGSHNVFANNLALAGHVTVGNYVNIGGIVAITQHVRVGDYGFIGAGGIMRKDLPPFMAAKDFSDVAGPNLVGLKRRGFSDEDLRTIMEIYKVFYISATTAEKALNEIEANFASNPRAKTFIEFVRGSKIGVQR